MSGHTQPPPDGQPLLLHSLGQPLHGVDDGAAAADPHHLGGRGHVVVHGRRPGQSLGCLVTTSQLTTLTALLITQLTSTDIFLLLAVLLLVTRPLTNWPAQQPAGMTTQHSQAAPHRSHGTSHTTSLLYQYCSQATDDLTRPLVCCRCHSLTLRLRQLKILLSIS